MEAFDLAVDLWAEWPGLVHGGSFQDPACVTNVHVVALMVGVRAEGGWPAAAGAFPRGGGRLGRSCFGVEALIPRRRR